MIGSLFLGVKLVKISNDAMLAPLTFEELGPSFKTLKNNC